MILKNFMNSSLRKSSGVDILPGNRLQKVTNNSFDYNGFRELTNIGPGRSPLGKSVADPLECTQFSFVISRSLFFGSQGDLLSPIIGIQTLASSTTIERIRGSRM